MRTRETIVSYGEVDEPMLKMTGRMVKYVNRIINHDRCGLDICDLAAGG